MGAVWRRVCAVLGAAAFLAVSASAQELYFNDFDGAEVFAPGVTGGLSGVTTVEPVQGFAGIGPAGGEFAGDFIRSVASGDPASATILTLNDLPPHTEISVGFLLATIDSWDGTDLPGTPGAGPDFFNVSVDGDLVFSETFTNLSPLGAAQSYAGPALVLEQPLGFESGVNREDSGYDLRVAPELQAIPHTASTLTLELFTSGAGWQHSGLGAADESWGADNLTVFVPVPEPACAALLCLGILTLGAARAPRWLADHL